MRLELLKKVDGLAKPLGEELLRVHRNYQPLMASIPPGRIKGAAHITGGGLVDNLPRILPAGCDALIDTSSWKVPPIFRLIQQGGDISREEMYQVFNMGIGMVLVVSKRHAAEVLSQTKRKGDWTNCCRFWQGASRLEICSIKDVEKATGSRASDLGGEPRCRASGSIRSDVALRVKTEC